MRARWLLVFAVGCQSKAPPAAKATGSASAVAVTPADAQAIDAAVPKLAIACGPAMLAPRIPAPKGKASLDVDAHGQMGTMGQAGLGLIGGAGGDLSANGVGVNNGFAAGTGVGVIGIGGGTGRSNVTNYSPASFKLEGLTVQGALDKAIVQRVMARERSRFIACFESALQKASAAKDSAHATVNQLVVSAKGEVVAVNVDGDARECLQPSLKSMQFPEIPGGGIEVVKVQIAYTRAVGGGRAAIATAATQAAPKPVAKPPPIPDTRSWTPYAASLGLASDDTAQAAGDELVKLMPLAKLETCFAGKNASERAMVTVAFDGAVIGARTGGSGDAQVDSCIAVSLIGLKVTAPPTVSEVACDIVRGEPQPWRVAPESYTVLEVGDKEIKEGGVVLTADKLVPAKADATHAFLIVVDPAAPPAQLARAFKRTAWAGATLVALKTEGAPQFIAMGLDGRMREKDYAPMLAIQHVKDDVKSCIDQDARGTAPKAEVETLLQTLANACDPKPCPATVSIALGGTMQDLVADADAARRAKLTRIGLSTTGCP